MKDDEPPTPPNDSTEDVQAWLIFTLAPLYILLTLYCLYNIVCLTKSGRLQRNSMLLTFYLFTLLTLFCKEGSLIIIILL